MWQDRFTPEAFRAQIKKLVYEDGLSASQAAAALGKDVSKGMVIRQMQTIQGKTRSTVTFPDSVWPSTVRPVEKERASEPEALEAPVHLVDAKAGQCRAPLWPDHIHSQFRVPTTEHMFCGRRAKDDSSYCDEHHALFYPPELQKRKAKPKNEEVKDNSRHFQ